jgi:hypothetical protein
MAGRSFAQSLEGVILIWSLVIGTLILAAFVLTPVALVGIPAYVGYRLWRDSPARAEKIARAETEALYNHALSGRVEISEADIDQELAAHWPSDMPHVLRFQLLALGREIYAAEGLSPEIPPPPALCNTLEGGRYRDQLAHLGQVRHDRGMGLAALDMISRSLAPIARAAPSLEGEVLVEVTQFLDPLGSTVEAIVAPFFEDSPYALFRPLQAQIDANLRATTRSGNPVFPRDYKGDDLVDAYLRGTPLREAFRLRTPFSIPDERRFEHLHMVAGSGHGKTQTLQYLIAQDLPDVARQDRSVVVIDSQGDLINTILRHADLPPERIVLIDPEDIAWPVSLNLFSVGQGAARPLRRAGTGAADQLDHRALRLRAGLAAWGGHDRKADRCLPLRDAADVAHPRRHHPHAARACWSRAVRRFRKVTSPSSTARRGASSRPSSTARSSSRPRPRSAPALRVLENQTFERMFSNPATRSSTCSPR